MPTTPTTTLLTMLYAWDLVTGVLKLTMYGKIHLTKKSILSRFTTHLQSILTLTAHYPMALTLRNA